VDVQHRPGAAAAAAAEASQAKIQQHLCTATYCTSRGLPLRWLHFRSKATPSSTHIFIHSLFALVNKGKLGQTPM
jgi:hypothetical protein